EAVQVEDAVRDASSAIEKVLRRHGRRIVDMQFAQRRVADITIDLYGMMACLARATPTISGKGETGAERQDKLAKALCGQAATRIRRNLDSFHRNDDELIKSIADDAYEPASYMYDVVLATWARLAQNARIARTCDPKRMNMLYRNLADRVHCRL